MNERHDKDILVRELEQAGATIKGREVLCPFHEDRNPSGSIYEKEDVWRFKCHACGFSGDIYDVRAKATNQTVGEVLKAANPRQQKTKPAKVYPTIEAIEALVPGTLEQRYTYTHPETKKPDLIVLRYHDGTRKLFWQVSPAQGGFIIKGPPGKLPLYNRTALQSTETVVVVEGEKCVHAMREYDHVATTSPGGAGKAHLADWTPLAGKYCILWPDNDEPGGKHMQQVESILRDLDPPCRIARINPSDLDLREKEDVANHIEQLQVLGKSPEDIKHELNQVLLNARPMGTLDDLVKRFSAIKSGEYTSIPWPWINLSTLTRSLVPGDLTVICGSPGASKSLFMLQAALYWHSQGINFALYELENDKPYHQSRALAQLASCSDITDPNWVQAHPEEIDDYFNTYQSVLDSFSRHLWTSQSLGVDTQDDLADWTLKQAKAGYRILIIDPITAVTRKGKAWEEDLKFIKSVKHTATEYGISVVLVTHPQKGEQEPSMHNLAGSAAFERFAETIITIHAHDPKESSVTGCCGTLPVTHTRTVRIDKARNGRGAGFRLAYEFDSGSLTLKERGIITKEVKKEDDKWPI